MTRLILENISVEFPLYQQRAHSLKHALVRAAVGSSIGKAAGSNQLVVKALQTINLDLREGDRLALVGPNGSGKSTLLRVMAGIYHPTQGTLQCLGRRMPLFDIHSGFDDEATGFENIVLRGLMMGFTRAEMECRMEDIAAFSGLGDFLSLPVRTYSSGMMFRILFSISTSSSADIILMDEWIATGDKDFIASANKRLHDLVDESRILVFACHDFELLRKLCNRAILLERGTVKMAGSVDEVLESYVQAQTT